MTPRQWLYIVGLMGALGVLARSPRTVIPRIIWTYWNDDKTLPDLVKKCTRKWIRLNPDHDVRIVRPTTIRQYIEHIPKMFPKLTPQQQADWLRLHLLKKYGGLWVDASIMVSESFAWVHACESGGGLGYYIEASTTLDEFPVMENWFIAAAPDHPFIHAWCKEFDRCISTYASDGNAYIQDLQRRYGPEQYKKMQQKIAPPLVGYLTMHMAAQKVMQIDGIRPFKLLKAEEGPFLYLERAEWDSEEHMNLFAVEPVSVPSEKVPKFVKLIGGDRNALRKVEVSPQSLYATHFS